MYFQIKSVILWPRNSSFSPRLVNFKTGSVNVISGSSRTGKSSIVAILDYCLGSDDCAVPVRVIRETCSWFGIVVALGEGRGEILLARREPGEKRSTSEMYIIESAVVDVPRVIDGSNATVETVKELLNEIAGVTPLSVGDSEGGFDSRPSFRDSVAFVFQPQSIVANPNVLFYRTESYVHAERLRRLLPYFLGAVSSDDVSRVREVKILRREIQRQETEYNNARGSRDSWLGHLRGRAQRAAELGLIPQEQVDLNLDELVSVLSLLSQSEFAPNTASGPAVLSGISRLREIESLEQTCLEELRVARQSLLELERLKGASDQYTEATTHQSERLSVARWLSRRGASGRNCPICKSKFSDQREKVAELVDALERVERSSRVRREPSAAFDRERERLQSDVLGLSSRLRAIRDELREIDTHSKMDSGVVRNFLNVAKFLGGLEELLDSFRRLVGGVEDNSHLDELRRRLGELSQGFDQKSVNDRLERAGGRISFFAGRVLPLLDVDRPNDPVSLSLTELTVSVLGPDRKDGLWEIGSGANWLSYHIAMILGLQLFFLEQRDSRVPGFVVIDQPSQVYFPRVLARSSDDADPTLADEDVLAVHKVFRALSDTVVRAAGQLQVIVLDHAGKQVWEGLDSVCEAESEWRGGSKLVPAEWLD